MAGRASALAHGVVGTEERAGRRRVAFHVKRHLGMLLSTGRARGRCLPAGACAGTGACRGAGGRDRARPRAREGFGHPSRVVRGRAWWFTDMPVLQSFDPATSRCGGCARGTPPPKRRTRSRGRRSRLLTDRSGPVCLGGTRADGAVGAHDGAAAAHGARRRRGPTPTWPGSYARVSVSRETRRDECAGRFSRWTSFTVAVDHREVHAGGWMPAVISLHGCTRCQRSTDPRLRVAPEGSGEPPVVTSDARPGPGERVAAAAGAATARSVGPRTDRAALAIDAEGSGQRRGWGVDARGTAARSDPGMGASGRRAPECEHVGVPGRRGRVATSTP